MKSNWLNKIDFNKVKTYVIGCLVVIIAILVLSLVENNNTSSTTISQLNLHIATDNCSISYYQQLTAIYDNESVERLILGSNSTQQNVSTEELKLLINETGYNDRLCVVNAKANAINNLVYHFPSNTNSNSVNNST